MAPVQMAINGLSRSLRRKDRSAAARRSGARGQPSQGCARLSAGLWPENKLDDFDIDDAVLGAARKLALFADSLLECAPTTATPDDEDAVLRPEAASPSAARDEPQESACSDVVSADDKGLGDLASPRLEDRQASCDSGSIGATPEVVAAVCAAQKEAEAASARQRIEARCAITRSNVGEAVSKNLDHETRAAASAAAFLRRLAKVGPETTPEMAAIMWRSSNGEVQDDDRKGEPLPNPWRQVELKDLRPVLRPGVKSVTFAAARDSVHEVVPYSEIYGRHPREFVFGRAGAMLPVGDRWGFTGLHQDNSDDEPGSSDSEDEESYAAMCAEAIAAC